MHLKFFEYIVIYLSVLLVCVLVGTVARLSFLDKGGDEYTANIVFWSITAFSILIYGIIILCLDGILVGIKKVFPKKNNLKVTDVGLAVMENVDIIRENRQKEILAKEKFKKDIAINYTRKEFALYTANEDLKLLCDNILLYSEKNNLINLKPVKIKKLSNLDLYHFGWNIWKHFNVSNQIEIASFLKIVFAESFKDVEIESIKRHLKDDELKGIITIKESLSNDHVM